MQYLASSRMLYSYVKRLTPALEGLQQMREDASSHNTVWAAHTVAALFYTARWQQTEGTGRRT